MEGGNYAIDPSTNAVDSVDDLRLLTTHVDPVGGALLTVTGDTSAAAASAARCAATIQAHYPNL